VVNALFFPTVWVKSAPATGTNPLYPHSKEKKFLMNSSRLSNLRFPKFSSSSSCYTNGLINFFFFSFLFPDNVNDYEFKNKSSGKFHVDKKFITVISEIFHEFAIVIKKSNG